MHPLYVPLKRTSAAAFTSVMAADNQPAAGQVKKPRNGGNPTDPAYVDILSRMYPTAAQLEQMALNPMLDRPVMMCEYAHSMGNSTGGLNDYWKLIRTHSRTAGRTHLGLGGTGTGEKRRAGTHLLGLRRRFRTGRRT